jgi:excisionase family DNA binding protein
MNDVAERAQAARATNPFLTAKQAAFHLGLAYSTLKAMRASGKGPRCRLHGRTWRYHVDDLDAWSNARTAGGNG